MENGGNNKVNAIFEARLNVPKPNNHADLTTREHFVRDKYERRKFYDPAAFAKVAAQAAQQQAQQAQAPPKAQQQQQQQEIHVPAFDADFSSGNVGPPSAAARRRLEARRSVSDVGSKKDAPPPRRTQGAKSRSKSNLAPPVGDLLDFSSDQGPAPEQRRVPRKKSKELMGFSDEDSAPEKQRAVFTRKKSKENLGMEGVKRGVPRKKSKEPEQDLLAFDDDPPAPPAASDFADFSSSASSASPKKSSESSNRIPTQDIMSLYNTGGVSLNGGGMNNTNGNSMNNPNMNNPNTATMSNRMQQMNLQNQQSTMSQSNPSNVPLANMNAQQMQQQAMMYQQHMMRLQQIQTAAPNNMHQMPGNNMGGGFGGGNNMTPQQQQMSMMQQQQRSNVASDGQNAAGLSSLQSSSQHSADSHDPFASIGARGFR